MGLVNADRFYKMVGARIRHARKGQNKAQNALSTYLDVDRTTINRWESGKAKVPLHSLVDISNFLDEDFDYFLGRQNGKQNYVFDKRRTSSEPVLQNPATPFLRNYATTSANLIPNSTPSDPRVLILDRIITLLQDEHLVDDLYSASEIEEAIEERFGIKLKMDDLPDFLDCIEPFSKESGNKRAKALIDLIRRDFSSCASPLDFPDHVKEEVRRRIRELETYLYEEGYSVGEMNADAEKEEQKEKCDSLLELEQQLKQEYEIDFSEAYQSGLEDGYRDAMASETGPQDWDET